MRILSARILRARRNRSSGRVDALVSLTVLGELTGLARTVEVAVSAPARASGAPPLRARLVAAAKLAFAARPPDARRAARAA